MRAVGTGLVAATLLLGGAGCAGTEGTPRLALPEGFPDDVPRPRAARLRSSIVQEGQATVIWESALPPVEGEGAYRGMMSDQGWVLIAGLDTGSDKFLNYRKGERTVAVSLGPAPPGSAVGVACRLR